MHMIFVFFTVLAWISLVCSACFLGLSISAEFTYPEINKILDKAKGVKQVWPNRGKATIILFLSLAWVITSFIV